MQKILREPLPVQFSWSFAVSILYNKFHLVHGGLLHFTDNSKTQKIKRCFLLPKRATFFTNVLPQFVKV